jgi:hypothetical protein
VAWHGNAHWHPAFVEESLSRFEKGAPPVAKFSDLEMAMHMVDAPKHPLEKNHQPTYHFKLN